LRNLNWRRRIGSRGDFVRWAKPSVPTVYLHLFLE
jgi:hypothetical protein